MAEPDRQVKDRGIKRSFDRKEKDLSTKRKYLPGDGRDVEDL
jgi:hypothetical protein